MIDIYCVYKIGVCGCEQSRHYDKTIIVARDSELPVVRCQDCEHDTSGASDEECGHIFYDRFEIYTEEKYLVFGESEPIVQIRKLKLPKELIEFLSVTRNGKEKVLIDNREVKS